jgi:dipeptidase E
VLTHVIKALVAQGKVYAGWSAGSIVAGPTLQYFDAMDDPKDAPERILDGLHLTDIVIIPHIDNKDFIQGAHKADHHLRQAGYRTLPLTDSQALLIHGDEQKVI